MSNEEMNRAIHEFVGGNKFVGLKRRGLWYRIKAGGYTSHQSEAGRYTREEAERLQNLRDDEPVTIHEFAPPNYTGSLDAMAEAKKHLNREQQLDYAEFLIEDLADEFCDLAGTREHIYACNTFTAEQEARAFVRAVGRWQEKEKGVWSTL